MAITDDVLAILGGHTCSGISFSLRSIVGSTVTVNNSSFQRVIRAIRAGDIIVTDNVASLANPADVAEYQNGVTSNLMVVRPTHHRRVQEAVVVHESVHASLDIALSRIPRLDNELAAFIAEAFYLRRTGCPLSRYRGDWAEVAMPAVNSMLRGGTAPEEQIEAIRAEILADPVYLSDVHSGCNTPSGASSCSGGWLMDTGNG